MSPSETLIRWEANLCHLDPEPHVYQAIGEHVTTLLSDGLPQTCEPFFPTRRPFVASVMFIHRVLPSGSPRVNVIGRYIDCSPITGLWMYAMDDSGIPQPCTYYIGLNVGDFTTCRYQCNTGGLVSYIVIGNSNRRAMTMSDTAVICDIALVWRSSPFIRMVEYVPHDTLWSCSITVILSFTWLIRHYNDAIMSAMASQITSLTIVYSTVYSGGAQRKHQSSASLAFVRGIHRWPVNSLHKWSVTRKMFPFDDVIMWRKDMGCLLTLVDSHLRFTFTIVVL